MLSYERLRNMAVLINAVAFFTAVALGTASRITRCAPAALAVILATSLSGFAPSPASARCIMRYCKDRAATRTGAIATRSYITNTHRQPVGKIEGMTKE